MARFIKKRSTDIAGPLQSNSQTSFEEHSGDKKAQAAAKYRRCKLCLSHWGRDDHGSPQILNNRGHLSPSGIDNKNSATWKHNEARAQAPWTRVKHQPADPRLQKDRPKCSKNPCSLQNMSRPYFTGTLITLTDTPKIGPIFCFERGALGRRETKLKVPSSTIDHAPQITPTLDTLLQKATEVRTSPKIKRVTARMPRTLSRNPNLSQGLCSRQIRCQLQIPSAAFSSSRPSITNQCSPLRTNLSNGQPYTCRELSMPCRHHTARRHRVSKSATPQVNGKHADRTARPKSWQDVGLQVPSSQHVSMCGCVQMFARNQRALTQPILSKQLPRPSGEPSSRLGMPGNKMCMPDWDHWADKGQQMRKLSPIQSRMEEAAEKTSSRRSSISGEITLRRIKKPCTHTPVKLLNNTLGFHRPEPLCPLTVTRPNPITSGDYERRLMRQRGCSRWSWPTAQGPVWQTQNEWRMQWPEPPRMTSQLLRVASWTSMTEMQNANLKTRLVRPLRCLRSRRLLNTLIRKTPCRWDRSTSRKWIRYRLEGACRGAPANYSVSGGKARPDQAPLKQMHPNTHAARVTSPNPCDQETDNRLTLQIANCGLG